MNTIERLENWNNQHKSHSCTIEIDNGYGASCWCVELHGLQLTVKACETGSSDPDELAEFGACLVIETDRYRGFIVATAWSKETLWVAPEVGNDDWAGLERVINCAIDYYEKFIDTIDKDIR